MYAADGGGSGGRGRGRDSVGYRAGLSKSGFGGRCDMRCEIDVTVRLARESPKYRTREAEQRW